jgi:alpha-L-fucosidase
MNLPGIKFATPEQKLGSFNRDCPWESCVTMQGEGWFWNGGNNIMWPESCVRLLVNAAVGDGNLLLDFGPTDKGSIYEPIKENYLSMGKWLKKYGESIYATRGGPYKPGTWGGSTCQGNNIYLHITQVWPGGKLHLPALPAKIVQSTVLTGGKATVVQTKKEVVISMDPSEHVSPDTIIKLTLNKNAEELTPVVSEDALFVSLNASATASSHIKSWHGFPGSVTLQDFEVKMPETKYFGEDSEPTAKPESNHQFKPTKEMIEKYPWIQTRRDHIWRYWMADPSDKTPWLVIDFGKKKEFNKVTILEKYDRIKAYHLEYEKNGQWVEFYKGGKLDSLSLALPKPIQSQKVRITITDWSSDYDYEGPGLREFDFWFDAKN